MFKIEFDVRSCNPSREEASRLRAELEVELDKWRERVAKLEVLSRRHPQFLAFAETGTVRLRLLAESEDEEVTSWLCRSCQKYLQLNYSTRKLPFAIAMQRIPSYGGGFRPAAAWTKRIDVAARLYNWSAQQTFVYATEALVSRALEWYNENTWIATWWQLREGLEDRFDNPPRFYTQDQPHKVERVILLSISQQRCGKQRRQSQKG